jgi:aquaglyceroporin related protein, other eukaryote
MLMFIVFAIADPANNIPSNFAPLLYFFLVFGTDASLGWQTGCAVTSSGFRVVAKFKINPAGDLGPRVFSWMAGHGSDVCSAGNMYSWVSILSFAFTKDPNRRSFFGWTDRRPPL